MKQTIEIEVPDGKKAVWKDNTIVFEDIKPQLPKTWEAFCNNYEVQEGECYINSNSDIEVKSSFHIRLRYGDSNLLPNKQAARQHLALIKLHQLRDCYRQGWVPDWNNVNENKYSIISDEVKIYIIQSMLLSPCFLAFQSEEIAEEFLNNFKDLIEQAGDLI